MKLRKRKPFNPMLGETFEMVTESFRFLAEKVEHNPTQIVAFCLEGKGFRINGFNHPQPKFKFNGGRGLLEVTQLGTIDIYFSNFNEHISVSKPTIQCKNIIWGGLYIDIEQEIKAVNMTTKEQVVIQFIARKSEKVNSMIVGTAFDANNKKVSELSGSWLDEIHVKDSVSGVEERLWTAMPLVEDSHMQYYFNKQAILMNFINEAMEKVLSPTDSRFRTDLRFYEEGHVEQAEA